MSVLRLDIRPQIASSGKCLCFRRPCGTLQDEMERVQLRDTVKTLREDLKLEQEESAQTLELLKTESEKTISRLEVII